LLLQFFQKELTVCFIITGNIIALFQRRLTLFFLFPEFFMGLVFCYLQHIEIGIVQCSELFAVLPHHNKRLLNHVLDKVVIIYYKTPDKSKHLPIITCIDSLHGFIWLINQQAKVCSVIMWG